MKYFFTTVLGVIFASSLSLAAPTTYCSKTSDGKLVKVSTEESGSVMNVESWGYDTSGSPVHNKGTLAISKTAIYTKAQLTSDMIAALAKIVGSSDIVSLAVWFVSQVDATDADGPQMAMYSVTLGNGNQTMFWLYEGGGAMIGTTAACTP